MIQPMVPQSLNNNEESFGSSVSFSSIFFSSMGCRSRKPTHVLFIFAHKTKEEKKITEKIIYYYGLSHNFLFVSRLLQ